MLRFARWSARKDYAILSLLLAAVLLLTAGGGGSTWLKDATGLAGSLLGRGAPVGGTITQGAARLGPPAALLLASSRSALAIEPTTGNPLAWGVNDSGQLGTTTGLCYGASIAACSMIPVRVADSAGSGQLGGVAAIAAGDEHSLAVRGDGSVWAWGYNGYGQIGDNTTLPRNSPVRVKNLDGTGDLSGMTVVAAGWRHSLALKRSLAVGSWDVPWLKFNPPFLTGRGSRDPVHTLTGSFTYSYSDLAIPGRGPGPSLSRTYNSNDPRVGPLGPGWTHSYFMRLNVSGQGGTAAVTQTGPLGRTDRYVPNGDGTHAPPSAVDSSLIKNPDGTYATTHQDQSIWTFDSSGRLTSTKDRYGNESSLTYNANGQLTSVSDPAGRGSLTLAYDGGTGRLLSVTDWMTPTARVVGFQYDANGRLWKVTDREGKVTTYEYDGASSRLVRIVDARGNTAVTMTYDAQGRVATQKDARGNVTNFCHDVDYAGAAISGSRGNLTRRIDPPPTQGGNRPVTLFKYDSKNNLIQTIPPRGVNSGSNVDCGTNLNALINTAYATDLTFDAATLTRLESTARRYTDPDLGQQVAITTTFFYSDTANPGLVTKIVPPRGNTGPTPDETYATTFAYGTSGVTAGMLLTVTNPLGDKTTYDYDGAGRRIKTVDPLGNTAGAVAADHTWLYEYDQEDRLRFTRVPTPTVGAAQLVSEFQYDAVGNRVLAIEPNGQITKYLYDERDSLQSVVQSPLTWTVSMTPTSFITTEYQYDDPGNLQRVVRASGNITSERAVDYLYDGLNRLRKELQYPSWPVTSTTLLTEYTYDANGNRLTLRDPLSQTTTFGYDALNRLTSVTYSDGQTPNVGYGYDANGNRTIMTDTLGTTTYAYDELGRPLTVTTPGPKTVGYRYDPDGNRTKVIYPDNTAVTYTFNKASQLESLLDWGSRTTSYQYFPDGLLKTITNTNSTTAAYSYDNARRLVESSNRQGTNTISLHSYSLDLLGNRTRSDEVLPRLGPPGALGTPRTWGYNFYGQLGNGSTADSSTPVTVTNLSGITAVVAGDNHSLALKPDGTVWAWGLNDNGQLGDGTWTNRTSPVQVVGPAGAGVLSGVSALASLRYRHSLALKSGGTAWAWGGNWSGQLGDGTTETNNRPVQVKDLGDPSGYLSGTVSLAAGLAHSLAAKSDGTVRAWGENGSGQLGDGTNTNRSTPVPVSGLSGVQAVAAGSYHSLALKTDGAVWAWGGNAYGELGDGTTTPISVPVQVKGPGGAGYLSGVNLFFVQPVSDLSLETAGVD